MHFIPSSDSLEKWVGSAATCLLVLTALACVVLVHPGWLLRSKEVAYEEAIQLDGTRCWH
jgi:hypothetical protein